MKKYLLSICFFAILCGRAAAQAPVDLFDPFYEDVSIWENTGLITDAPMIRPYPLQEIERLLQIVMEKGDPEQQRKAAEYQKRFFQRAFHFGGSVDVNLGINQRQRQFFIAPFVKLNYQILKILSVSAYAGINFLNKLDGEGLRPLYSYTQKDIASDAGSIGKIRILPMINSSITLGTPEYYLTAGLSRTSMGPFHNTGIYLSPQTFHAGQFIFTVNKKKWAYHHTLLLLSATGDNKKNISPNKFLASHSIVFRPLSWLSFSVIESMVYGERFDPMYIIPFAAFFLGQSIYDFPDNSLLGFNCSVKPVRGLRIDAAFYLDDIGFNEIVKFKQDAKLRMAAEFGLSYTMPRSHWFSFIDCNYTLVTPFMYTHYHQYEHNKPNYQNYTHHGQSLGSNLDPNSDRVQLRLQFRPLYGLMVDISDTFIRHANALEGFTDIAFLREYLSRDYTTDGSVFNHTVRTKPTGESPWAGDGFAFSNPFMKQQTIQYINQLGLDISCHLPIVKSGGSLTFKFGYVFETNVNPGVQKNLYTPRWNTGNVGSASDADILAEAEKQLADWRSKAAGVQFNHYIKLAAEVAY